MTTATGSSRSSSSSSASAGTSEVDVYSDAYTPEEIRSVLLADGYHNIAGAEYVQFAIGEAHSPIAPQKLYPSLRFQDQTIGGAWVTVPLRQILGVSKDQIAQQFTSVGMMSNAGKNS